MDIIEKTRLVIHGTEFDWLWSDASGCVAVCATAGFGEVPVALLEMGPVAVRAYSAALDSLLETIAEIGGCRPRRWGARPDAGMLRCGARGFYVFDWQPGSGPYRRVVVPERPRRLDSVPAALGDVASCLPAASVSFAAVKELQLPSLLPCRRLHSQ